MTRARSSRPALARVGSAVALTGLLAGCGFEGAQSFPLPGGVATGDDAYELTVEFSDVLDLVRQSSVKVDDVTVGSVSDIRLKPGAFVAVVTVRVLDDVELPANATASLRQTSLLGEKFVSLERPTAEPPVGRLQDGDLIPLSRTERSTEVEEVLGALSLVLNGGSLEQLQTINREVVLALEGRESEVKDLLRQLDVFVGGLDDQKAQIVRALDALDRLSARLAAQRQTLAVALRDVPQGAAVLSDQRESLVEVLTGLERLGEVATRTIRASQQNTVADLRALQPILTQLAAAGSDLPNALELLLTYPFPETVREGIKGDYANLFVTADLNLQTLGDNTGEPVPTLPTVPLPTPLQTLSPPPPPGLPPVPDVTGVLPTAVPGLPRGRAAVPSPTPAPGLGGLLGDLTGSRNDLLALLLGGLPGGAR